MVAVNNWVQFCQEFSQTDPHLPGRLSTIIPNLTDAQFKVCLYLRAGYSNQHIAETLELSLRSRLLLKTKS